MSTHSRPTLPRSSQALLREVLRGYPVAVVTGARQTGKTTLIAQTLPDWRSVSLEDLDLRDFAQRDPRQFLAQHPAPLVIDEAQHVPQLFSYIQTEVDRSGRMGQYVLSGSQQFSLAAGISQSLAGRAGFIEMHPLRLKELALGGAAPSSIDTLMLQGGYPAVHARQLPPARYYADYTASYLERDVRSLTAVHDLGSFQRFMRLCAARTGQLLNLNSLANDCGISQPTAAAWMNVLEAGYIVRRIAPYFRNIGKRLVKAPKLYFLDTGLCAWLLGIASADQLGTHYARGALFETWVVNEALKSRAAQGDARALYYWRDNIGTEIDIVLEQGADLTLVEIKSGHTYQDEWRKNIITVQRHLGAGQAVASAVIYGGDTAQMRQNTAVIPWHQLTLAK